MTNNISAALTWAIFPDFKFWHWKKIRRSSSFFFFFFHFWLAIISRGSCKHLKQWNCKEFATTRPKLLLKTWFKTSFIYEFKDECCQFMWIAKWLRLIQQILPTFCLKRGCQEQLLMPSAVKSKENKQAKELTAFFVGWVKGWG